MSVDTIQTAVGAGALGFGLAGIVAPGALTSIYGLSDVSPDYRYLTRMWGTRTAVIGVMALTLPPGKDRDRLTAASAAMNATDAAVVLTTKGLPFRTRFMAGLTSAGFAGAAVYALKNGG